MATTNKSKSAPANAPVQPTNGQDPVLDAQAPAPPGGNGRGMTLSSLDPEARNNVYLKAGTYINEVLSLMIEQFPGLLVGDIASVLAQKALEKQFGVSVNPTLRALAETLGQDPEELLNEVAQVSKVSRRYLSTQELESGVIFKINTLLGATPKDLFKNKKNQQVNLYPAPKGWILDILNP